MTNTSYIFIGGSFRTGTDLLRNILNRSEEVALCGETHYMGNFRTTTMLWQNIANHVGDQTINKPWFHWEKPGLASRQILSKIGDISTENGAKKVVDYLYNYGNTRDKAFWRWLSTHVNQEEFLKKFLESEQTERDFFDLMMSYYANDSFIRGEKTPAHIHYLPILLKWFPDAKFVHMFRDPRAIFCSQKKKRSIGSRASLLHLLFRKSAFIYEIYMSSSIIIQWLRVAQLHLHYQQLYPDRYYLLRFKDMVVEPDKQLQALCDFLGIKLTDQMLNVDVVNSSFSLAGQTSGFDKTVIDRWQKQIHPVTNKWFSLWCKKYLAEFGYLS